MKKHRGFRIVAMVFIGTAILALITLAVMFLWNWLIPAIFVGGPEITYWQALGLMVLSKILFGGFKPHHPPSFSKDRNGTWKDKFREHWNCMDEKKKEKIRNHMFSRFNDMPEDEEEASEKKEQD